MFHLLTRAMLFKKQNKAMVSGMMAMGTGAVGFGLHQWVNARNMNFELLQQRVVNDRETPEQRARREHQIKAIENMLRGLKHKNMRQKLEAAVDAKPECI